jgi:hypothetical protein
MSTDAGLPDRYRNRVGRRGRTLPTSLVNESDAVLARLFRAETEHFVCRISRPRSSGSLRDGTFKPDISGKCLHFPPVSSRRRRWQANRELFTGGGRNLLRCHRCATGGRNQKYHLWNSAESVPSTKQSKRPLAHELTPTPELRRPPKSSSPLQCDPSHHLCHICEFWPG